MRLLLCVSASAITFSFLFYRADVDNYNIELTVKFPRIEIRGKYDVSGNVLLFPVRSKGDFWAIFRKQTQKFTLQN